MRGLPRMLATLPRAPIRRLSVTVRRILLALALIAAGVLIGLPIARLGQPGPGNGAARGFAPLPPTSVEPVPVQIGPDEDDEPTPAGEEIPELRTLNRLFTSVASRATEAVVYIEVDGGDAGADPYYGARTTAGSGVIISPAGYVLTNAHVLEGGRRVTVVLTDKREYAAEVVGRDPTTDLAVLRLLEVGVGGEEPLPVATLGDSDDLLVGEWVLAVGSPFRLTGTVTQGIVSALGRSVGAIQNEVFIEDFIQTDAPINQGNSGGALVNLDGEVVGIVTAIATDDRTGVSQGYGFAAPANLARRVAEDLIAYGEVRRGYVGIQVGEMTAADARERGMDRIAGVLVSDVYAGGPGARAGLRPGDVLLEVNGVAVDATNRFQSRVALAQPNERLELTIWRGGERLRPRNLARGLRRPRPAVVDRGRRAPARGRSRAGLRRASRRAPRAGDRLGRPLPRPHAGGAPLVRRHLWRLRREDRAPQRRRRRRTAAGDGRDRSRGRACDLGVGGSDRARGARQTGLARSPPRPPPRRADGVLRPALAHRRVAASGVVAPEARPLPEASGGTAPKELATRAPSRLARSRTAPGSSP